MIGAGGQAGQGDAANLLKPALARGELRTIAATTWSEYKKYFEKDPALARRFQVVKVEEPDEKKCQVMMRGVVPMLEKHHNGAHSGRRTERGREAFAPLSARPPIPDKAVSVLDTACARLSLGQNTIPPAIEDASGKSTIARCSCACSNARAPSAPITPSGSPPITKQKAAAEARHAELQCAMGKGARSGRPHPRRARASWKANRKRPRRRRRLKPLQPRRLLKLPRPRRPPRRRCNCRTTPRSCGPN